MHIFRISSHSLINFNPVTFSIYPISMPIYSCVMSSAAEPLAISINHIISLLDSFSIPSAILLAIDSVERVIWSLKPKFFEFANSL